MEQFYDLGHTLQKTVNVIRILAVVDILTTVCVFVIYFLWTNITEYYSLLLILHMMHIFSWLGALSAASPTYDPAYFIMIGMAYLIAFILDISVLIVNINDYFYGPVYDLDFQFAFVLLDVIYVCVDLMQLLLNIIASGEMKQTQDNVNTAYENNVHDPHTLSAIKRTSLELLRNRGLLKSLAIADIFATAIIFIIFGLGLNINVNFGLLTYFQIGNTFMWIGALALSVPIYQREWVGFIGISYLITTLLAIASLILRLYEMKPCILYGTIYTCTVALPFAALVVIANGFMVIIGAMIVYSSLSILRELKGEYLRLAPLVLRGLRIVRIKKI